MTRIIHRNIAMNMGLTKTNLFNTEQNDLAILSKALAHPARVAILQHLSKADSCINSDLVQELGLAQATVSQHLKALKDIGLIQGTIEGVSMCYCINQEKWQEVGEKFNTLFNQFQLISEQTNCC